jgi:hypothetical protein
MKKIGFILTGLILVVGLLYLRSNARQEPRSFNTISSSSQTRYLPDWNPVPFPAHTPQLAARRIHQRDNILEVVLRHGLAHDFRADMKPEKPEIVITPINRRAIRCLVSLDGEIPDASLLKRFTGERLGIKGVSLTELKALPYPFGSDSKSCILSLKSPIWTSEDTAVVLGDFRDHPLHNPTGIRWDVKRIGNHWEVISWQDTYFLD